MRSVFRSALLGAMIVIPASAMAWWWPFQPSLPESAARSIAHDNGVTIIEDIDPTVDADWSIEGFDEWGNAVKLVIDGRTGAVERGEVEMR